MDLGLSWVNSNARPVSPWGLALEKLIEQNGKSWGMVEYNILEAEYKAKSAAWYGSFAKIKIFDVLLSPAYFERGSNLYAERVYRQLQEWGIQYSHVVNLSRVKALCGILVLGITSVLGISELKKQNLS